MKPKRWRDKHHSKCKNVLPSRKSPLGLSQRSVFIPKNLRSFVFFPSRMGSEPIPSVIRTLRSHGSPTVQVFSEDNASVRDRPWEWPRGRWRTTRNTITPRVFQKQTGEKELVWFGFDLFLFICLTIYSFIYLFMHLFIYYLFRYLCIYSFIYLFSWPKQCEVSDLEEEIQTTTTTAPNYYHY